MTPGRFDLAPLYRGDSYHWRFRLWQDEAQTVATDLTGATVKAEVRDKPAGLQVAVLTTAVTLPNTVDVNLTPAMYAGLPAKGVWDLELTFATGEVHTPVAGEVSVTPDVTNSVPVARR